MVFNFEQKPGQTLEKKCIQEQITPRVSIVTPYYNSGRNFEETYRCVINQTMREFEWIIMDDGSSRKEDIELLERLGESDTRIHVFTHSILYSLVMTAVWLSMAVNRLLS